MHADPATKAAITKAEAVVAGVKGEPAPVAAPPAVVDAQGKLHSPENGKYVEKPSDAPAEGTPAAAPAVAAEGAVAPADGSEPKPAGTEEGAAPVAPTLRKIEVQADHPIRQGLKEAAITVADEESERAVKALLNGTHVRRVEVEAANERAATAERLLAEERSTRIQREAHETATKQYESTPEYQAVRARWSAIRNDHDGTPAGIEEAKKAATAYWRGSAQVTIQGLAATELKTRQAALEEETSQRSRETFVTDAKRRSTTLLPDAIKSLPQLNAWLDEEMASFEVSADRGHFDAELAKVPEEKRSEWLHQQFGGRLARRLAAEPAVMAAYAKPKPAAPPVETVTKEEHERALAAARTAGAEDFKAQAAGRRAAVPPNPLAGVTAVPPGAVSTTPEQPDYSKMTPHEIKKAARSGARADARALFG